MQHLPDMKQKRDDELAASNGPFNVHDRYKGLSIEELRIASDADRVPWHTLFLNVTGDLNVGTMIRTSHCLGASSVIIFGRQKIDNRSLVGAANYIKVERARAINENLELNTEIFMDLLMARNLTPVFVESNGLPLPLINWNLRLSEMARRGTQPCLIMGNETGGIPKDMLNLDRLFPNSFTVSIPQRGVIRSMNVAVAHAMVAASLCTSMGWIDQSS
jgi:tRNA G18 (ribose-2'-O)-methylase SpoU